MVATRRSQTTTHVVEATIADTPPPSAVAQKGSHKKKTKESSSLPVKDETKSPSSSTPTAVQRRSRSSSKPQRKEEELLRHAKNTGVGISIDIGIASESSNEQNHKKPNKKTIFGEDELPEETDVVKEPLPLTAATPATEADDDDDDNDAVEEVKGSSAREEILHQLDAEEKGALKPKKAKKRKDRTKVKSDTKKEGEEFDDEFFAELEAVKAVAEEEKKRLASKTKKGKHTTFVVDENEETSATFSQPKKVGHNIQVVVLEDVEMDDAITAVPTSALSADALLYSRSFIPDGSDKKGGKRKRNSPTLPDTSWKRSRKMNLIVSAKGRFNGGRKGRGRPAANFVRSTTVK